MASGSGDGTVRVWDVESGRCLQSAGIHRDWVYAVCISADGGTLVSGGFDRSVAVWGFPSLRLRRHIKDCLPGHIQAIDISRDASRIVVGGMKAVVHLIDVETGRVIKRYGGNGGCSSRCIYDRDGSHVYLTIDFSIRKFPRHNRCPVTAYSEGAKIWAFTLIPQAGTVLIGGSFGFVIQLDTQRGVIVRRLPVRNSKSRLISASTSGDRIVVSRNGSGSSDCLDGQTGRILRSFVNDASHHAALLLNATAATCFSGYMDGTVHRFDTESAEITGLYEGHRGAVRTLALDRAERHLLTGGEDGTGKKWGLRTGRCLMTFEGHQAGIRTMALDWRETHLYTGSDDATFKIWNISSGQCLSTVTTDSPVTALRISVIAGKIVTGHADGRVLIWDIETASRIHELCAHGPGRPISGVEFLNDEKTLISGSHDGTLRFWDLATCELLSTFYYLANGFLWTTPPDAMAPCGWLWTDRPDMVNLIECDSDGSNPRLIENETRRRRYFNLFNDQEMVMDRLNRFERYRARVASFTHQSLTASHGQHTQLSILPETD